MKCVFILQVASHARYWRRIDKMIDLGVTAKVFSFEREFYQGKRMEKKYISLGNVQREKYFKRVIPIIKAIKQIRDEMKDTDVIYTFGLDTFLVGYLSSIFMKKKVKLIYEVGDIRKIFMKQGVIGETFRLIERFVLRKAYLVIVTSEAFIDGYFKGVQNMHDIKYHLIENKPEVGGQYIKSLTKIKGDNSKIRIGYFGVLRCLRSWEILKNLAQNYSDKFDLYIRGLAVEPVTIESECNEMGNVKYEGPYLVPDDLSSMYNQVDIVWACYPYQGSKVGNWCWAKTTRFYEACLFKKPMITQAKTQDALFISKYNIGIKLDLSDINKSVNQLIQLSKSDINQMTNNFQDVPIEVYTYGDEHEKLIKILKGELL